MGTIPSTTFNIRAALATSLFVVGIVPAIVGAQILRPATPTHTAPAELPSSQSAAIAQTAVPDENEIGQAAVDGKKTKKSVFAEDGPVDTTWDAQIESFWRAANRLPVAAALSAILAFRPRRRGTPTRQAPVIQTQIVLAPVGAMVMMVVGASLARAFGIVGAAGLIRLAHGL